MLAGTHHKRACNCATEVLLYSLNTTPIYIKKKIIIGACSYSSKQTIGRVVKFSHITTHFLLNPNQVNPSQMHALKQYKEPRTMRK